MNFQDPNSAGVVDVVGARETRKIDKDTIEVTIRGRPISLYIPQQYQADYDVEAEVRLTRPRDLTDLSLSGGGPQRQPQPGVDVRLPREGQQVQPLQPPHGGDLLLRGQPRGPLQPGESDTETLPRPH